MAFLLDGAYAPITNEFSFVEAPADESASAWVSRLSNQRRKVRALAIRGDLPELLQSLLQLTNVLPRRWLFLSTRSIWSALFTNQRPGGTVASESSSLALALRCRSIRVVSADVRSGDSHSATGHHGGVIFELYQPQGPPHLLSSRILRSNREAVRVGVRHRCTGGSSR
jgi:hypothetical protein